MQENWQSLISTYLETRDTLKCVVVIIDIRHEPKAMDTQLLQWLREQSIPTIPVYTKIDKLSGSKRQKNASLLDAGHTIKAAERVLFSAKTGQGREQLVASLEKYLSA
jgi:GTP-binding protein